MCLLMSSIFSIITSFTSVVEKKNLSCEKCEFSAATFIVDYVFVKNTTAIKWDQTIDGSDDFWTKESWNIFF